MTVAAIILAAGGATRFAGGTHKLLAKLNGRPLLAWALDSALAAGFNELIVVQGAADLEALVIRAARNHGVVPTVLTNHDWAQGQAGSLQLAISHARLQGHDAVVVGLGDQPGVGISAWRTVGASRGAIVAARFGDKRRPPVKLDRAVWDLLPTTGDDGARILMESNPDLVVEVICVGNPSDIDTADELAAAQSQTKFEQTETEKGSDAADQSDDAMVERLLGRAPMGSYSVVLRRNDRSPVVLSNGPLLADGTPMPTRFWLCDPPLVKAISHIESAGGVRRAESELPQDAIERTHALAKAERESLIPADYAGPRPFGGVGGTRQGVKCLHTHFANYLAGAPDVIGEWTDRQLAAAGDSFDPAQPGIASHGHHADE